MAGVLTKSRRRDAADLPPEPERLLDSATYDGFPIRPLYTNIDERAEPGLPGAWPFVRGGDALRDVKSGWKVAEAFPAEGSSAEDGNGAVLVGLTEGVSALVLRVGGDEGSCRPRSWTGCSRASSSTWCPWCSRSPAVYDYVAAADALLALLTGLDDDQRSRLSVDLGADPLTAPLAGRPAPSVDQVVATAEKVAGYGGTCGRSPWMVRPSTIWAPTPRGSSVPPSPPGSPICACWSTRACRQGHSGRSASGSPPTTTSS